MSTLWIWVVPAAARPATISEALGRRSVAITGASWTWRRPRTMVWLPDDGDVRPQVARVANVHETV